MVVPVSPKFDDYASQVHKQLHDAGLMADVDTAPGDSFNKKIRNAQLYHYNFIMVVGEHEERNKTVNVRTRNGVVHGEKTVEEAIAKLKQLKTSKAGDDDSSQNF